METQKCPFCGAEILSAAKKCKYCGKWMEEKDNTPKPQNKDFTKSIVESAPVSVSKQTVKTNKKLWLWIISGIVCICLICGLFLLIKSKQQQLHIVGTMQFNSDYSYYVGIGTTNINDLFEGEEGSGDCPPGYQIIVCKSGSKSLEPKSILKSSQLDGPIINAYPSSKYPTVVYFGGIKCAEGDFSYFYGKVDIKTLKYDTFEGDIFGIIEYGTYKDCYLTQRGDLIRIYPQSPVGEAYDPVYTFPKNHFGNAELWDPNVRKSIIRWLENQ